MEMIASFAECNGISLVGGDNIAGVIGTLTMMENGEGVMPACVLENPLFAPIVEAYNAKHAEPVVEAVETLAAQEPEQLEKTPEETPTT